MPQIDVYFIDPEDSDTVQTFRCWADDAEHAMEQCRDAEPRADILGVEPSED